MSYQNILEYLRESPNNTNVNVVKGMIRNSGGDGDEISYPKISMQVTPGMAFKCECLSHSYEDFMNFENNILVWLDEEWTNGQTSNEFHGVMKLEKVNDVIFLLGLSYSSYEDDSMYGFGGLGYKVTTTKFSRISYSFDIYK